MRTKLPIVSPMPLTIDRSVVSALIPLNRPIRNEVSSSAKNAFSLNLTINSKSRRTETPRKTSGMPWDPPCLHQGGDCSSRRESGQDFHLDSFGLPGV